jgi:RNA polymerase sigma factor (sigma-70 family)
MNKQSDRDVLRRGVETVYREERRGLLARAARSARSVQDAEDALQEAFAGALANLDSLALVENLPGWIFASLRNRLADLWRRSTRRRLAGETAVAAEALAEIAAATGLSPEDGAELAELSEALAEAIGALPPEQRFVIEGQALEGLGFRELSEQSGVPINTLMARKRYAIAKLARALQGWAETD